MGRANRQNRRAAINRRRRRPARCLIAGRPARTCIDSDVRWAAGYYGRTIVYGRYGKAAGIDVMACVGEGVGNGSDT
jgi:hypothetical protein